MMCFIYFGGQNSELTMFQLLENQQDLLIVLFINSRQRLQIKTIQMTNYDLVFYDFNKTCALYTTTPSIRENLQFTHKTRRQIGSVIYEQRCHLLTQEKNKLCSRKTAKTTTIQVYMNEFMRVSC